MVSYRDQTTRLRVKLEFHRTARSSKETETIWSCIMGWKPASGLNGHGVEGPFLTGGYARH